jgi:hypothetical protein
MEKLMKLGASHHDSLPLLKLLAGMANLDLARVKRAVLTVDVGESPKLYVETYLTTERVIELTPGLLTVIEQAAPDVVVNEG